MQVCQVRDLCIGEGKPKVCLPIVGKDDQEIINEIQSFEGLQYDLVELRIDFYQDIKDVKKVEQLLKKIRSMLQVPLLLTYRSLNEGGQISLSDEEYKRLVEVSCTSGCIDLIDIELMSGHALVYELVHMAHENQVFVVMSNHDFEKTPSLMDMKDRLEKMEILGADICKLAVMPQSYKDVISLLDVTIEMSNRLNRPIVTMAMGEVGKITRISGELTGSAITFASARHSSAPGQMNVIDMQMVLEAIHHD